MLSHNVAMTFPLGSLRGDGSLSGAASVPIASKLSPSAYSLDKSVSDARSAASALSWRTQAVGLVCAVLWLLALLALATHHAGDRKSVV